MRINIFGQIARIIGRQLNNISKKAVRLLKLLAKPMVYLNNYVRQQVKSIIRAPSQKSDYIHIAGYYLSKRLLGLAAVGVAAAAALFTTVLYPWMEGRFWVPSIQLNSAKMAAYSGPARIKNEVGTIIYTGDVAAGRLTGSGTQYDAEGELVYRGQFLDASYEGLGALYAGGVLRYEGGFSQNRYSGQGKEYDENGALIYQGSFLEGVRSGLGMEYRPDTHTLCYRGYYVDGQRQGSGVAYEEDGVTMAYQGEFAQGLYEGPGRLYENGTLRYQGQFVQGQFEGIGILYDSQGALAYEGEFTAGNRQGAGTVFDSLGAELFSGTFLDGNVNYIDYLGTASAGITAAFGTPGYTTQAGDRQVLAYLNLHTAFLCADMGEGNYVCDRILVSEAEGFLGVGRDNSLTQLEQLLGERFSSLELELTEDRAAAFAQLSIDVPQKGRVDKYRISSYYIKAYYDAAGEEIKALECGSY